jgi:hypothetical protein
LDPVCKICRKEARREKYTSGKRSLKRQAQDTEIKQRDSSNLTPKGIIEPEKPHSFRTVNIVRPPKGTIEPRKNETNTLVNTIDFTSLEKTCGKKLSESDRYNAVQDFNEFVSLLREGYSDLIGEDVYVK